MCIFNSNNAFIPIPLVKQFLVTVTDEFIETRQLAKRVNGKKIEIENRKSTKCAYSVK